MDIQDHSGEISDDRLALLELILAEEQLLNESSSTQIEKRPADGQIPLAYAQARVWFLEQMYGSTGANNIHVAFRLDVPIETQLLEKAVNLIWQRHETLRTGFAEELVQRLNREGLPLSMESILEKTGPGTVGKSHITKAIIACGIEDDITVAYRRFFGSASDYHQERLWVEAEEAFSALDSAGALKVLAHPGYKGDVTDTLIKGLAELGLDGIEVFHPYHKEEEKSALSLLAEKLNLAVTGGSDCHGPYEGESPYMSAQNLASDEVATFLELIS